MSCKYFGTDGIRGLVGRAPITPDFALRLAHAVGQVLRQSQERPLVLIGKDTRISGYMLESALESGFNSAGVDVLLLGPLPTPGVAYLTRAQRASLGVVISASHNPYYDNGIKFFSAHGSKLPDAWEESVEHALQAPPRWAESAALGRAQRLDDAAGRYIEFCKSTLDAALTLRGLKIVVDAAHGAAWQIAPKVFHELGADVIAIGCAPDGLNINDGVGATQPDALALAVRANHADFGVALDGDGDRLALVDGQGRIYDGDELLYLLAAERLARGQRVAGVVGTLMSNLALERALAAQAVAFVRAPVGDRHVLEALHQRGWHLGGENSGHLLVLDKHTTGDGLISALQALQAVLRSGRTLAQWLQPLALLPQVLVNVRLPSATGEHTGTPDWRGNPALVQAVQAVQAELGAHGRVLVRASGTEPLLRIMVEAPDAAQASDCAERVARVARGS